jgi:hypothetical protein
VLDAEHHIVEGWRVEQLDFLDRFLDARDDGQGRAR